MALLGRGQECAFIDALLADVRGGRSRAIVFRGEAGIGKSSLLNYMVARAEDMTVLAARGVESESELAFSALADVIHPILGELDQLPTAQSAALQSALAIGPPAVVDPLTISVATLSVLAAVAERGPVLVVVDDAHWLDPASRRALMFSARRLQADRVGMVFAARTGEATAFEAPGLEELLLHGIDGDSAHELLNRVTGTNVPTRVAHQVFAGTAGNPLAILEIPHLISPAQLRGSEPLNLPLPSAVGVQGWFARRIADLPDDCRLALLVVAASQSSSAREVNSALAIFHLRPELLDPAETAGLIRLEAGRVEFRHPLVRSAVYFEAVPAARRAAHQALADALKDSEPVQRAWHLAAATVGEDEAVAQILAEAALQARSRGAPLVAATTFERAARLTPEPNQRALRLLEAAADAYVGGDSRRAMALVEDALRLVADPALRAELEHARGRFQMWAGSPSRARELLLAAADRIRASDPDKAALMLGDAITTCSQTGDLHEAIRIGQLLESVGATPGGLGDVVAKGLLGKTLILVGESDAGYRLMLPCQQLLESTDSLLLAVQLAQLAVVMLWLEHFERARAALERVVRWAREAAAPGALPYVLCHLSEVDFRCGRWAQGYANAAEAEQIAIESDQPVGQTYALVCMGWFEAGQGREGECRRHQQEALRIFGQEGITIPAYVASVLGLLELGLGNIEPAVEQLESWARICSRGGLYEPAVFPSGPDLVEAYIRAGRRADAEAALADLEAKADRTRRSWALGAAARCRGMLAEDDEFEAHFREARKWHEQKPNRFEWARTELAFGERLRRARRRAEAREPLHNALLAFGTLAAVPWISRAENELRASGEVRATRERSAVEQLTRQELQIALKVAEGATNREVASALFLSPKTVEAHLSHIYGKLAVRSRTELAVKVGGGGASLASPIA